MVVVQGSSARQLLAGAMVGGANAARVLDCCFNVVFAADLQAARRLTDLQHLERRAGKGSRYLRSLETDLAVFSSVTGSAAEYAVKVAVMCAGGSKLTANSSEAWAFKNTALAAQTLMLGATAHGLGSCAMEGLNANEVCRVLHIPPGRYSIAMVVSVGFPADASDGTDSLRYELCDAARLDRFDCPLESQDTN
jgi:nitroreductase